MNTRRTIKMISVNTEDVFTFRWLFRIRNSRTMHATYGDVNFSKLATSSWLFIHLVTQCVLIKKKQVSTFLKNIPYVNFNSKKMSTSCI